ncbi:hypothetical protein Dimus_004144, partial [Dionaea muscipula]
MGRRKKTTRVPGGSGCGDGCGGGGLVTSGGSGGDCGRSVGLGSGGLVASGVPTSGLGVSSVEVAGSAPERGSCRVVLQPADSEDDDDVCLASGSAETCINLGTGRWRVGDDVFHM